MGQFFEVRKTFLFCWLVNIFVSKIQGEYISPEYSEKNVRQAVDEWEIKSLDSFNRAMESIWNWETNQTDENHDIMSAVVQECFEEFRNASTDLLRYETVNIEDEDLKRILRLWHYLARSPERWENDSISIGPVSENYNNVEVCSFTNSSQCDMALEPDLSNIFLSSQDPEELKHYWIEWYASAGTAAKNDFFNYVQLKNESAISSGLLSAADEWLNEYEDDSFESQVETALNQIMPFYKQMHAYVRFKLRQNYGSDIVPERGPIPMHLLGDLTASNWEGIYNITAPFPETSLPDFTEEMVRQEYNVSRMFHMAEDFFVSLNMSYLPESFWKKSMMEKTNDGRRTDCETVSRHFYKKDDVRIKICSKVNMRTLFRIHEELAVIQYYLQFQHLPSIFRETATRSFRPAFSKFILLSVTSPKHLKRIGLLSWNRQDEQKVLINHYFKTLLDDLVFLPFVYTIDKYRWDIFRGEVACGEANCKFWELRSKYSGIEPPVKRSEADFDAPAEYFVANDEESIGYLIFFIVKFQFHQSACKLAGEYVPGDPVKTLNNCDIHGSIAAGEVIKAMLSLGHSKPWPAAMQVLTGETKMNAEPLLEYYKPLYDWLVEENRRNGAYVGWDQSEKCSSKQNTET
ncbi:angiotensin-converting enzyme-like [Uranotaenia lowii]|uniref:angiotensin-converting enzyme-like n=1 Tax=Uranotaenia lowii TaxID=190385 RepID=UPI00247AE94D|nr:angiotensin-converting enzyme-like [Uranotaenia lowii]